MDQLTQINMNLRVYQNLAQYKTYYLLTNLFLKIPTY